MIFKGGDGDEYLEFILAVKQEAFAKGTNKNDGWMAEYAETRMGGAALLWFEDLDEETQGSWKLLKRALISKYSGGSTTQCVWIEDGSFRRPCC